MQKRKYLNPREIDTLLDILEQRTQHYQLMMMAKEKGDMRKFLKLQEAYNSVVAQNIKGPSPLQARTPSPRKTPQNKRSEQRQSQITSRVNSKKQLLGANLTNQRKTVVLGDMARHVRLDQDGIAKGSQDVEKIIKSESQDNAAKLPTTNKTKPTSQPKDSAYECISIETFSKLSKPSKSQRGGLDSQSESGERKPNLQIQQQQSTIEAAESHEPLTPEQLSIVSNLLKEIKFFRERNIIKTEDINQIALTLRLEKFQKEEMVFDHGDQGDRFYIILRGGVGVDIPIRAKVEPEEQERRRNQVELLQNQLAYTKNILANHEETKRRLEEDMMEDVEKMLNAPNSKKELDKSGNIDLDKLKRQITVNLMESGMTTKDVKEIAKKKQLVDIVEIDELQEQMLELDNENKGEQQKSKKNSQLNSPNQKEEKKKGPDLVFHVKNFFNNAIKNQARHIENQRALANNDQQNQPEIVNDIDQNQIQEKFSKAIAEKFLLVGNKSRTRKQSLEKKSSVGSQERVVDYETQGLKKKGCMAEYTIQNVESEEQIDPDDIVLRIQRCKDKIEDIKEEIDGIHIVDVETIYKRVAHLYEGDSFGELALIDSRKGVRAARIVSTDSSWMGVLSAEDYNSSLAKIEKKKREKLTDFLLDIPQFQSFSRMTMRKILNKLNPQTFHKGDILIREGEIESYDQNESREQSAVKKNENNVYIILEGEFAALQNIQIEEKTQKKEYQQNKTFMNTKHMQAVRQQMNSMRNSKNLQAAAFEECRQFIRNVGSLKGEMDDENLNRTQPLGGAALKGSGSKQALKIQEKLLENKIIIDPLRTDGMKKSLRAKIENKMNDLTSVPNLTKKKIDRQEILLTKYGAGKVFGVCPVVIQELKTYQPCTIKCVSLEGKVLCISMHEFEKYILSSRVVHKAFRRSALNDLIGYNIQKLQKFNIIKYIQQLNDKKTDELSREPSRGSLPPAGPGHQDSIDDESGSNDSNQFQQARVSQRTLFQGQPSIEYQNNMNGTQAMSKASQRMSCNLTGQSSKKSLFQINTDMQSQLDIQRYNQKRSKSTQKKGIELRKYVIEQSMDKREAIKEIVSGYPKIARMTILELGPDKQTKAKDDYSGINFLQTQLNNLQTSKEVKMQKEMNGISKQITSNIIKSKKKSKFAASSKRQSPSQRTIGDKQQPQTVSGPQQVYRQQKIPTKSLQQQQQPASQSTSDRIHFSSQIMQAFERDKQENGIEQLSKMFDQSQNQTEHFNSRLFSHQSIQKVESDPKSRLKSPKDTSPPYIYSPNYNNNYAMIAQIQRQQKFTSQLLSSQQISKRLIDDHDVTVDNAESTVRTGGKTAPQAERDFINRNMTAATRDSYDTAPVQMNNLEAGQQPRVRTGTQLATFANLKDQHYVGGMFGQRIDTRIINPKQSYEKGDNVDQQSSIPMRIENNDSTVNQLIGMNTQRPNDNIDANNSYKIDSMGYFMSTQRTDQGKLDVVRPLEEKAQSNSSNKIIIDMNQYSGSPVEGRSIYEVNRGPNVMSGNFFRSVQNNQRSHPQWQQSAFPDGKLKGDRNQFKVISSYKAGIQHQQQNIGNIVEIRSDQLASFSGAQQIQESLQETRTHVGSNIKGHGWFTGHMANVPIKFGQRGQLGSRSGQRANYVNQGNSLDQSLENECANPLESNFNTSLEEGNRPIGSLQVVSDETIDLADMNTVLKIPTGTIQTGATSGNYIIRGTDQGQVTSANSKEQLTKDTLELTQNLNNYEGTVDYQDISQRVLINSKLNKFQNQGGSVLRNYEISDYNQSHLTQQRMSSQKYNHINPIAKLNFGSPIPALKLSQSLNQPHGQSNAPFSNTRYIERDNRHVIYYTQQGKINTHFNITLMNKLCGASMERNRQPKSTYGARNARPNFTLTHSQRACKYIPVAKTFMSRSKKS